MKLLVTGGFGFIGTNLLPVLAARGHALRVLDDLSAAVPGAPRPEGVELVVGSIADRELVASAMAGCDGVVHLAAQTNVILSQQRPMDDCAINVVGTLTLLEAARQADARRFVFASSNAPVGDVEPPVDETRAPRPLSPYGASKLAGEGYCSAFFGSYGLETVALRFANVYGPWSGLKTSVVARFIRDVTADGAITIYGDGGQTRDFIHVADLVEAIALALETSRAAGGLFQVGTGRETSVRRLAELVFEGLGGLGRAAEIREQPERAGEVRRSVTAIGRARDVLGWQPAIDVSEGVPETCRWFLERRT
ncbi:MAG: NAD-dependent epimerase/dehydratase family protein [Acidobacteriota bacterium]|nr:NAD-dependent epimerase/dehydratase family protein [Acidobacteriota bacterium]